MSPNSAGVINAQVFWFMTLHTQRARRRVPNTHTIICRNNCKSIERSIKPTQRMLHGTTTTKAYGCLSPAAGRVAGQFALGAFLNSNFNGPGGKLKKQQRLRIVIGLQQWQVQVPQRLKHLLPTSLALQSTKRTSKDRNKTK